MTELERTLSEIALLGGLDKEAISILARFAEEKSFEPGGMLLREGQAANVFYILMRGNVAIEAHGAARGPLVIQTIDPGEIVGWSWMVEPYTWHFDARAVTAARVIALDAAALRAHCEKNHSFGYELLRLFVPVIARRLDATRLQLLDLYGSR